MDLFAWKDLFEKTYQEQVSCNDASHDLSHCRRVARIALQLGTPEKADLEVLIAAAYFHDLVNLPKDHAERSKASTYSAEKSKDLLQTLSFPEEKIPSVYHAIQTHSFSANLPPQTLEAQVLQDADRSEALGMIGLMRCFYVSGRLDRPCYDPQDPLATNRPFDDLKFGLDHFEIKLLKLPGSMQTETGKKMAWQRAAILEDFRSKLVEEVRERSKGFCVHLADACWKAGREENPLFHPSDPFAKQREYEMDQYALDALLPAYPQSKFLTYLEEELLEDLAIASAP